MLLLLVALTVVLVVAGPAAASSDPLTASPPAAATVTPQQVKADLLGSLRSWRVAAPPTKGYGAPSAAEDDVVFYNRDDLYWEVHIYLKDDATPYQIGQQYARAMLRCDPNWTRKVAAYIQGAKWATWLSYETMDNRAKALKQTVTPDVRGYVEGMAKVIEDNSILVDEDDCWILNLFPDVARPTSCSALGAWGGMTAGGAPILGRDLDWSNDPLLPTLNAITVYHNGDKSFCTLGYIGLWNVISGFNKSGLYAGILDAGVDQPYPTITTEHSYPMDLRAVLESTSTIEAAAAVMARNKYCFNHQIVLADKTRVGILENDLTSKGEWARKVRYDDTPLNQGIPAWTWKDTVCAVNSFISKGNNSALFADKFNAERWARYRAQIKMVSRIDVPTMKKLISYGGPDLKYWPYNKLTTMMMVYQPRSQQLDIFMKPRSGGLPDNPTWHQIQVDWGNAAFAGRWVKTWRAPAGWGVAGAQVAALPTGGAVAAAQLSRQDDLAVAVVRWGANGRARWSKLIDPAGADEAELAGLAVNRDSVVVGSSVKSDGTAGWLVTKYGVDGKQAWSRRETVGAGHIDLLGGVSVDARGNVFAGGAVTAAGAAASDWCVRKYTTGGKPSWQRIVAGEDAASTERVTGVAQLGRDVVVTGTWNGRGDPSTCSMAVARVATDGSVKWQRVLASETLTAPEPTGIAARWSGVAVSGRDTRVLTGAAGALAAGGRCAYRIDSTTGEPVWQYAELPTGLQQLTSFRGVTIDEMGNVTAAGAVVDAVSGDSQGIVSWFDAAGDDLTALLGGGGEDAAAAAVESGDRGLTYVALTVSPDDPGANDGMGTMCCRRDGSALWYAYRDAVSCTAFDLAVRGEKVYTVGGAPGKLVLGKYDTTTAPLLTEQVQ
jgi:hypothetical protein